MKLSFIIYNCSLLKIRVTSKLTGNLLYNTFIDGYMNKFYLIKVLRQTEEANVIVASSYNAVVKWSLMNSLYFYLRYWCSCRRTSHFQCEGRHGLDSRIPLKIN